MSEVADSMMRFHLVYDGPALEEHRMDVRALAPALLSVGDLIERANELVNGDQAKVSVNVQASFKTGCFGIDLESSMSWLNSMFALAGGGALSIGALCKVLGITPKDAAVGVIQVIRWIRGRQVTSVEALEDGNVRLHIDGECLDVERRVIELVRDHKLRKALEGVVSTPLEDEGIDSVSVLDRKGGNFAFHIVQSEAFAFKAPNLEDEELESDTYTANLQIVSISFQEGNKWRFSEGSGGTTFYAEVVDEPFLKRVHLNEEQFAKDDVIRAKVRRRQRLTGQGLKTEYDILEVMDHRSATPKIQLGLNHLDPE